MKLSGGFVSALLLAWPLATVAQDTSPRFQFEVENLLPANQKILQNQLKGLEGVGECAVAGSRVTISVKAGSQLKLTEIQAAIAGLKPAKDEKIGLKWDSLKLEGKVILSFSVAKNQDKIQQALLTVGNIERAERKGEEFHVSIKSPGGAKVVDIANAIAAKTENTDATTKIQSKIVKDVVWSGGAKPAAKEQPKADPGTATPAPSAQPPQTPPPQAQPPAPAKKPGG